LWSDGTGKRRWVYLPPGSTVDASNPDEWSFPVGTRLWKEFSYERPVETRLIERVADGSWRFATYVWNEDASDALLAPAEGAVVHLGPGRTYKVPSREDCIACHEGQAVPVLGFSALQLSPDRDPFAPHADPAPAAQFDLRRLSSLGWLRGLPAALLERPPRIAASSPTARAALGYLHGNCGHCHNSTGPLAGIELVLAQSAVKAQILAPGRAGLLTRRLRSSNPLVRMPPLGVSVIDGEGVALVERWIHEDLQNQPER
jgi:mono/diheme cytochrome c family protein